MTKTITAAKSRAKTDSKAVSTASKKAPATSLKLNPPAPEFMMTGRDAAGAKAKGLPDLAALSRIALSRLPERAKRVENAARTALRPGAKARTLRLNDEYEAGLKILKSVSGMPVSKMVNEAVGEYLERRTAQVETDLGVLLNQVKAYRHTDLHFKYARARVVEAEMRAVGNDPVDGVVVMESSTTTRRRKSG